MGEVGQEPDVLQVRVAQVREMDVGVDERELGHGILLQLGVAARPIVASPRPLETVPSSPWRVHGSVPRSAERAVHRHLAHGPLDAPAAPRRREDRRTGARPPRGGSGTSPRGARDPASLSATTTLRASVAGAAAQDEPFGDEAVDPAGHARSGAVRACREVGHPQLPTAERELREHVEVTEGEPGPVREVGRQRSHQRGMGAQERVPGVAAPAGRRSGRRRACRSSGPARWSDAVVRMVLAYATTLL